MLTGSFCTGAHCTSPGLIGTTPLRSTNLSRRLRKTDPSFKIVSSYFLISDSLKCSSHTLRFAVLISRSSKRISFHFLHNSSFCSKVYIGYIKYNIFKAEFSNHNSSFLDNKKNVTLGNPKNDPIFKPASRTLFTFFQEPLSQSSTQHLGILITLN